jgi:hypothetical protein
MVSRIAVCSIVAFGLALAPLAAGAQTENQLIKISHTAGTCPSLIVVAVVTKQYPGGFTMDYTARTGTVANAVKVTVSKPQRIAFSGALLPAYRSCEGAGRAGEGAFTLHAGTLSFVISPGKGPNGTYPGALTVDVERGLPHAHMSITD